MMVHNNQKKFKNEFVEPIFSGVLLFLYLYEFNLQAIPSSLLSGRKLTFALVLIGVIFISMNRKNKLRFQKETLITSLPVIYMIGYLLILFIIYGRIAEGSINVLPRTTFLGVYGVFGAFLFANLFRNVSTFFTGVIIATLIQSTIIYAQFLFLDVRLFFDDTFIQTGNVSFLRENRASGLGADGATLSLMLFCGMFACSYFILKKQKILVAIYYLYILFSAIFVARTGFYLGLLNGIILIIFMYKENKLSFKILKNIIKMIFISCLLVSFFIIVGNNLIDTDKLEKIKDWSLSPVQSGIEDKSLVELSNMKIPSLTFETLFGTGISRGESALGTVIQHDSGYIQSYFSLGLINAIIFYMAFYIVLFTLIRTIKDKVTRHYLYYFLIVIVFVEIKEPFIFKYMIPFVLITSCLLIKKEEAQLNINKQE